MATILTRQQQRVVDHRGGHLQVIACAGSGKTESISRRVAALVAEGVAPAAIIAFTFTERAAAELKARILLRVAEVMGAEFLDLMSPMYVGTIHAYCFRLLQDHIPRYGDFDVLDEHRQAALLSREYRRLGLDQIGGRGHWQPIEDFRRNVDAVENELIPPALLRGTEMGGCYEGYCDALDRYHLLSYGQIISAAVRELEKKDVFRKVHGPLRHLIVDEYQDVNPAQERLIELLGQRPVHVCVVGDDDQAIYQWRGSNVENIQKFTEHYHGAATVDLGTNRRSRPGIIQTARVFSRSIAPRLDKEMGSHRDAADPDVVCWSAGTPADEATIVARTIVALHEKGFRYRDLAILFRSVRTSGPPFIEALRERGVPIRCAGRTGLFLHPEISVLGQTYAWLLDYDWKGERYGEPESVTLESILGQYQRLFNNGEVVVGLESFLKRWQGTVPQEDGPADLVRDYYRLLRLLRVHETDLDSPEGSARVGALARFSQILADYENVTRRARFVQENGSRVFRGGQDSGIWYYRHLFSYLQHYALEAYDDFEGEETLDEESVDLLTVHQAKGLEWPVVFLPCLVTRRFPSSMTGRAQNWLLPETVLTPAARRRYEGSDTDERRLFYVAMTRARDLLYLSRFERIKNRSRMSPYLEEVSGGVLPELNDLPLQAPDTSSTPENGQSPSVSFSELALYEDCPRRFRLSQQLGFQPPLVRELGYGRAIHHVLQTIAEEALQTSHVPTEEDAVRTVERMFYLPFANRPAYEKMLTAATSLVSTYVREHHSDLERIWATERPFELHLDGGTVSGRADVILDREGGRDGALAIVDYKTAGDDHSAELFAFQLAVYTAAARGEGLEVEAAYLHDLKQSRRASVPIDDRTCKKARRRAEALIEGLRSARFDPKPTASRCNRCDVRYVCKDTACHRQKLE
ncbi:MAG: ATP-dependent DNA helicase [Planctomycetota bacterium]